MYCPNCGAEPAAGQKFCRACGFDLKPVSQLVAGPAVNSASDRRLKVFRRMGIGFLSVAAMVVLVSRLLPSPSNLPGGGLGLPEVLMIFAILAVVFVLPALVILWRQGVNAKPQLFRVNPSPAVSPESQQALPGQTTDKLLAEPSLEPEASVTEQTTRSLEEAQRKH